jgi:acyl carrier protein
VEIIREEHLEELNLSGWRVASNGAEPIRQEVLTEFATKFAPCGFSFSTFSPAYGLAETTLKVTTVPYDKVAKTCRVEKDALIRNKIVITEDLHNSQEIVGCGQTEIETEIAIVNPDTSKRCQSDEVGEIWVKGKTVAQGYWQNAEATESTFKAFTADTNDGPYLRTGDLGFFYQGELYVTGRLKDVIIIHGGNYYPQDIEQSIEQCYPDFRSSCTAAFSVEKEGKEELIVVQEVERTAIRHFDAKKATEAVRRMVFQDHELQVSEMVFIKPASIPKTSSGKIQRRTCREQYLNGELKLIKSSQRLARTNYQVDELVDELCQHPNGNGNDNGHAKKPILTHQTSEMVEVWISDWLNKKLKVAADTIKPSQPFADFGLDSIVAVDLAQDLSDWTGLDLESTIVWNYPIIEDLANHLANRINEIEEVDTSFEVADTKEILEVLEQISEEEISAFFSE